MLKPSPVHLKVGSHLGKYRILRELGEGPIAHVYVADDTILYRQIALKVLKPEFARQIPPEDSAEEEVSSAAVLLHSGIVPLYGSGFDSGYHYFTMALMPNGNLRDAIGRGLTGRQALTIVGQVARALSFAHAKGVNHQGIKPENILFRKDGSAVLSDFQAMKIHGFGVGVLTREALADPRYVSPEDIQNSGRQFGRADLYSLGTVLYEMLTGQVPFRSEDILWQQVNSPVPRLPTHFADYQFLIDKLLAKRPTDRFDANQLIQATNRLLTKEPGAGSAAKVTVLPVGGKMKSAKKPPVGPSAEKKGTEPPAATPTPEAPKPAPPRLAEKASEEPHQQEMPAEEVAESTPAHPRRTAPMLFLLGALLLVGTAAGFHLLLQPETVRPPVNSAPALAPAALPSTPASSPLEGAVDLWRLAESEARNDFAEALASWRSGDAGTAEALLEDLRQSFPQLPEPYNNLAAIRAAEGRLEGAQRLIEEGLRAHPSYAAMLENLNSVLLEKSLAASAGRENASGPKLILLPELSSPFSHLALLPTPAAPRAASPPAKEAVPPPEQVAPLPAATRAAAADLLNRWAQAWSAQDLKSYFSYYGEDFQPGEQATRAAWEEHRRQALGRPAWIMVALEEVHVSRQDQESLRVVAVQDYRSDLYRDRTLKGFVLGREGEEWKILREESLGIFR